MSQRVVNRAGRQVEPRHITDPDGDRERALQRSHRWAAFLRGALLFVAALAVTLLALDGLGAL